MPAFPGQVVGVDITLGCADPHAEPTEFPGRAPFVLSVTCKRTGFTHLRVMKDATALSVTQIFKSMLSGMGIRDAVQEVWTDNGKQFVSAEFAAMLRSVLPGVRHCTIPAHAPYAGGWYEVHHRALNQVLRALVAEVPLDDWQDGCDLAQVKLNCSSVDGGPTPFLLWYGREPVVQADRLLSVVFYPHAREGGEAERVSNVGASIRDKLAVELSEKRELLARLDAIWEDKFMKERLRAADKFRSVPVRVGNYVRTAELVSGKLDRKWSLELKVVSRVRGNVVFVQGEERSYHAWQIKVVRASEGSHGLKSSTSSDSVSDADEAVSILESSRASGSEAGMDVEERSSASSELELSEPPVKRARVAPESRFLQSLSRPRPVGKRTVQPTAKARAAGGVGGGTDDVWDNIRSSQTQSLALLCLRA